MTIDNYFSNPWLDRVHTIHFVGIGGAGMGGIAEVLLNQGFHITGSDLQTNAMTQRLAGLGAVVQAGHRAENVTHADVVVISSAVSQENPEVQNAIALRIPVVSRAEMLAELMRFRWGIAIAGTHGKTTTTSLVASILTEGGLDPTYVIGGRLTSGGTHAKLGAGRYLVAEADESDASFLLLKPMMSVVTNIDMDHMGTYDNNFETLKKTFIRFLQHLPFYGVAILCIDDPVVREILPQVGRQAITYGFTEDADLYAENIRQEGTVTYYTLRSKTCEPLEIKLNLPGRHNVLNSLAAIAIAKNLGVSDAAIVHSLAEFQGVGRRFQQYGDFEFGEGKVTLIDDYGHHPTEIAATINAVRGAWPERRLVMVFQPHRYSRTFDLFEDFCQVLSGVDKLALLEVYSAGEEPIQDANSRAMCRSIRSRGMVDPIFVSETQELGQVLSSILQPNDIVLTQGAGDVGKVAPWLVQTAFKFNVVNEEK